MAQILRPSNIFQSLCIGKPQFTEEHLPDQTGKVHIVTGGYAGVGQQLSDILYAKNATVYLAGRSPNKATTAIEALKSAHAGSKGRLEFLHVDLSDLTTIRKAVEEFKAKEKRLDVLVNNAGVMMPPGGSMSKQGYELQLATNCLGPYLLTKGLMPLLTETAKTSPAGSVRVIWASSLVTNLFSPTSGVALTKEGPPQISWFQPTNYGQSKAGNNFLASETQRRYGSDGIISVSFNPGNLKTDLQRHLDPISLLTAKLLSFPPRFGAYTELYCGWSPDVKEEDGGMFVVPWGKKGNDILRSDVRKAVVDAETDENAVPRLFWEWLDKETAQYA